MANHIETAAQPRPGSHYDEEQLAGTTRIFKLDESSGQLSEHVELIPHPTRSPNDPLNWSRWRKYWHATLVLFITAFTAATANDAGAGGDAMNSDLGIDYSVQNTAAGVLFIGIGYWTLLASPMPWLYGRRIQYLICMIFSIIGSVWFARTQNTQDVIWNQLFIGASEACAEALVQLSLSDLFFQHQRGAVMGIYILATSIGTFLGPLIAGYIAALVDWRWIGWTGLFVSCGTLVVFLFGLEETAFERDAVIQAHGSTPPLPSSPHHSTSDEKAAEDAAITTATTTTTRDEEASSAAATADDGHIPGAQDPRKSYLARIALVTPAPNVVGTGLKQYMSRLFNTLRVFAFPAVIYSGIQWGAQDAWLTFYLSTEEDYWTEDPWDYNGAQVALMNIPTLIGAAIGCIYGGWFSDVFVLWMAKRRGGVSEAEDRLWLMFASAIINPAGLFLFGIASGGGWDWPAPYVGLGMVGFGFGCAGDLSMAYLMDAYPDMVLEGMVGVAVINNTLACIFTFVCSYWLAASGLANTFIAIGVLSLFFQLLTIPMMYWGKAARRWTKTRYENYILIRDGA